MTASNNPVLVLASTSPFRATLLEKLNHPFLTFAPKIDETPLSNEQPKEMVHRLSIEKAAAAKNQYPNHLIIASDQCAIHNSKIIGKPGSHEKAVEQLTQFSGHPVTFLTGLCLLNTQTGHQQISVEPFTVYFRDLTTAQIERYLDYEQPYNCAGSFKSEGLGISLFEKMEGDDPNALIGLPLIRLVQFLSSEGMDLP